jgi:hypothetical protein
MRRATVLQIKKERNAPTTRFGFYLSPAESGGQQSEGLGMARLFTIGSLTVLLAIAAIEDANARGGSRGGGRVHYGGGHHTSSHGGHYLGGSGSSYCQATSGIDHLAT